MIYLLRPILLVQNKAQIIASEMPFPIAQKMRTGGYDGKGVQLLRNESDLDKSFDVPSVLEKLVDIKTELAVIVAVGLDGVIVSYPPVEMVFDPELNLVDYLLAPSLVNVVIAQTAKTIAEKTVKAFGSAGIFAVELFLDSKDELYVNEIAPRAHNSGHATIEAATISQYDMQLRIFQSLPIVAPYYHHSTIMWNLIGADGYIGKVCYDGLREIMSIENIYLHLYGKESTKPGRKMGHITILENDIEKLKGKLSTVKNHVRVVSEKMNSL
jgi:5-(carboxyamino)imidazole ribonucleotide synthase